VCTKYVNINFDMNINVNKTIDIDMDGRPVRILSDVGMSATTSARVSSATSSQLN
jgi:hypothetical protein